MTEDESVSFWFEENIAADLFPGGMRPQIRTADIGGDVIDLAAMKEQFEASRKGGA